MYICLYSFIFINSMHVKQTTKALLFVLLAFGLGTIACKKDELGGEAALTAASCWKLSKFEAYDPVKMVWEDVTEDETDPCELDDCFKFNSDKSATKTNGTVKCSLSEPATETGAWDMSADGKTFTLTDPGGDENTYTIVELSSKKFILESTSGVFRERVTLTN